MPRNGANIYSPPAGTLATTQTEIESAKYNAFVNDLTADANTPRPIVAGGTGSSTAAGAWAAFAAAAPSTGAGPVPAGCILMWSGAVGAVPAGWRLCDGTGGTPDLRGRFIVGAGGAYAVAANGGAESVTLSAAQIPAHTHPAGSLAASSVGDHSHASADGGSFLSVVGAGGATGISFIGPSNANVSGSTAAAGAHSHTISGATGSAGSGGSHENRPPYYALCYIMKL